MTPSIIIVTGLSGSGKSTAMRALEDQGCLCIDNLPSALLRDVLPTLRQQQPHQPIALVMDARDSAFLEQAPKLIQQLRADGTQVRIVYLTANEQTVVRRYSETRRAHPLDRGNGLRDAIAREQASLVPLRAIADTVIDTSQLTPHQLRAEITERIAKTTIGADLHVTLQSFGFKHGLPIDANMLFDVRFLPNPYFDPVMRPLSGLNEEVFRFVCEQPAAQRFLNHATSMLAYLVPEYRKEGKRYLTVAIGCTGGQHRSVSIARALASRLCEEGTHAVDTHHRDVQEGTP